jgi:hypothetical protein
MARATVQIDDRALRAMVGRLTGSPLVAKVSARCKAEAEQIAEEARKAFPVSRWASGAIKNKPHARDSIEVVDRTTPRAVAWSVVSSVPYIYYIRSYQIGESDGERADRMKRRPGESDEDYDARRTVGRRRHAWATLVATPGKKRSKSIVDEMGDDLLQLAKG